MKAIIALVLSVFALTLYAQTNAVPALPSTGPSASLLLLIIPVAVPLIIALGKFFVPKLPTVLLPILAPALGTLIDYITMKITGGAFSPVTSALLGSAGVGLREILDQVRQQTQSKPTP